NNGWTFRRVRDELDEVVQLWKGCGHCGMVEQEEMLSGNRCWENRGDVVRQE
ncbi:hypothetical protein A2U01_0062158, partial [Trifolium medium]|nr:hypothetical protein [Trifolium medium]